MLPARASWRGKVRSTRRCVSPSEGGSAPTPAEQADMKGRERALAAMIRAGHDFAVARAIVRMTPGEPLDIDKIRETTGLMEN